MVNTGLRPIPHTWVWEWGSVEIDFMRQAQPMRAFACWQNDFRLRVRSWQVPHSHQSGVAACVVLMDFAVLSIGRGRQNSNNKKTVQEMLIPS